MNVKFKFIKYIVSFILITISVIVVSELNAMTFYDKLCNQPHIEFESIYDIETLNDIKKSAYENNITFYKLSDRHNTVLAEEIYVYANNANEISEYFNFKTEVLKSIFEGKVVYSIKAVDEMLLDDGKVLFYMIGDDYNIKEFTDEISDKYELSRKVLTRIEAEGIIPTSIIWIAVFIIVLLLGIYEVSSQKKEAFLRSVFGEEMWKIIVVNVVVDIIAYILILVIDYVMFHNLISWEYSVHDIIFSMLIVIAINSLMYLSFLKNDSKTIIKDTFSGNLMIFNNIFKLVSTVSAVILIVMVLRINGVMQDYKKIDEFARRYKDYSLCTFQNDDIYYRNGEIIKAKKADEVLNENIYRKNSQNFNPVMLVEYEKTDDDISIVYANINAYDYLVEQIDAFENESIEKEICIMLPDDFDNTQKERIIKDVNNMIQITEGPSFKYDYQTFTYKNDVRMVSLKYADTDLCNVVSDPVIIYNSVRPDTLTTPVNEPVRSGYMHDILYMVEQDDIDEIIDKYSLQKGICEVTNFYEYYSTEYQLIKSKAMILYFIVIVIFTLEILITTVVVILNYKIYSIELCMKKVFGYSIIEKNKFILGYNFLCIFIAFLISNFIFKHNFTLILSICLLLLLIEFFITILQMMKVEKQNTNHVIKGK